MIATQYTYILSYIWYTLDKLLDNIMLSYYMFEINQIILWFDIKCLQIYKITLITKLHIIF